MLNKIAALDSQVIRALLVAIVGLIGLLLSFFGFDEGLFTERAGRVVDALLLVLSTGGVVWAGYARAYLPTPPITSTAIVKTQERQAKEGGFARIGFLALISAVLLSGFLLLPGCQSTRAAYQAADSLDETSYVISEHYASLVREAADLASRPTTPRGVVRAMQEADLAVAPVIDSLRRLRDAYVATRDAKTEAALQEAVNQAVILLADLVRQVNAARGAT